MSVLGDNPSRLRSFSGIFGKRLIAAMPCRLYFLAKFSVFSDACHWQCQCWLNIFFLKGEDFGCLGWIPDKKQKGGGVIGLFCNIFLFWWYYLFEDTFKFWWNFLGIFVRERVLDVAWGRFLARRRGGRCHRRNTRRLPIYILHPPPTSLYPKIPATLPKAYSTH